MLLELQVLSEQLFFKKCPAREKPLSLNDQYWQSRFSGRMWNTAKHIRRLCVTNKGMGGDRGTQMPKCLHGTYDPKFHETEKSKAMQKVDLNGKTEWLIN